MGFFLVWYSVVVHEWFWHKLIVVFLIIIINNFYFIFLLFLAKFNYAYDQTFSVY